MTNTRDWLKEAILAERAELAAQRLTPRRREEIAAADRLLARLAKAREAGR